MLAGGLAGETAVGCGVVERTVGAERVYVELVAGSLGKGDQSAGLRRQSVGI